jgi:chalcone isomerase
VFVSGDFEKFTRVTMILPLTGEQYAEKLTENCVAFWKAVGLYTDAEGVAVEKFKEVFKPETFPPGASILFTHSPSGVLTVSTCLLLLLFSSFVISVPNRMVTRTGAAVLPRSVPFRSIQVAFSKDSSVPAAGGVAIENKHLCEAVLESIIGEHGVSPAAKLSLAARVSELLTKGTAATADEPQAEPVSVTA